MECICDTNVFDAYHKINALEDLFLLDTDFLMYTDTIERELIDPPGFGMLLLSLGLIPIKLQGFETFLIMEFSKKFPRLSIHDSVALAIAKSRNLTLLTGDNNLRKAAYNVKVPVIGSIGILDKLYKTEAISRSRYIAILEKFLEKSQRLRLPEKEIQTRLKDV
ncbi:MAG TPA: hypothetical protein PLP30_12135 [Clostridia bacterium]|nr:hypothetical protein [Clostridia bacterium]